MSEKVSTELPQPSQIDLAYNASGAAIASIPGVGPAAEALFKNIVSEPLQKRRDKWFTKLAFALRELQERFNGFDPNDLKDNENFIDVVSSATQAAMKTHNEARREALKNAVLNSAVGMTVDDVLQGKFLRLIEEFTGVHIRILSVLANPGNFDNCQEMAAQMMGSQIRVIRAEIPQKEINESIFDIALNELNNEGLINIDELRRGTLVGRFLLSKRTTEIGDLFLKFITEPDVCDP